MGDNLDPAAVKAAKREMKEACQYIIDDDNERRSLVRDKDLDGILLAYEAARPVAPVDVMTLSFGQFNMGERPDGTTFATGTYETALRPGDRRPGGLVVVDAEALRIALDGEVGSKAGAVAKAEARRILRAALAPQTKETGT